MKKDGADGIKGFGTIHAYKYKVAGYKVHSLDVPQPRIVESNVPQKLLKGQLVLRLIELGLERIRPVDIFFYLFERRMLVATYFFY